MKRIAILLFAFIFCAAVFAQNNVPRTNKVLSFNKGINLTVWMEYSRMNTMLYGRKDFENIKSLGVEVVRLPVWFEIWNEGAPGYKVSDECWQLLDNAVDWCEELGMSIIIDFHNDCDGSSKTNPKIEQVPRFFREQATPRGAVGPHGHQERPDAYVYQRRHEPV